MELALTCQTLMTLNSILTIFNQGLWKSYFIRIGVKTTI